jgi:hypothetical protein
VVNSTLAFFTLFELLLSENLMVFVDIRQTINRVLLSALLLRLRRKVLGHRRTSIARIEGLTWHDLRATFATRLGEA